MMTSAVNHLWARARLGDVQPRQDTWSDECLRAGFKGRGADTAWYGTALEAEVRAAGGGLSPSH
eukprot:8959108-Alexandrium_andersonii.AAC.1